MKYLHLLPLIAAPLAHTFVLPDEAITSQILLETKTQHRNSPSSLLDRIHKNFDPLWKNVESGFEKVKQVSSNALDTALSTAEEAAHTAQEKWTCAQSMTAFDVNSWLESSSLQPNFDFSSPLGGGDHPHHPPPHHPPHHKPGHGHHDHDHKPNQTIYQLISSSKYTTKLAKLVSEYPDLVETLNGTAANYTLFAPTDAAFEKIPHHGDKDGHKPSKELIKKVLAYHLSPEFYPAGRVLVSHTIPTALGEDGLGGAQRLRIGLGLLKGLNLNFYSKIVAINIFATNGVIHGIDSLLLPPPPALKIIEILPGEFSTLQLALIKTGLGEAISKAHHIGGTLFAPSNWAFKKLGPRINAFLFSSYGETYLKALLKYHVVANQTLYSDAFYGPKDKAADSDDDEKKADIPKGHFHVDLPTLLEDKSLSIDIGRWGGFIDIKINAYTSVATQDGIARDGVIQILSNVLVPPKTPGGSEILEFDDLEEFKLRLIPEGGREDL